MTITVTAQRTDPYGQVIALRCNGEERIIELGENQRIASWRCGMCEGDPSGSPVPDFTIIARDFIRPL